MADLDLEQLKQALRETIDPKGMLSKKDMETLLEKVTKHLEQTYNATKSGNKDLVSAIKQQSDKLDKLIQAIQSSAKPGQETMGSLLETVTNLRDIAKNSSGPSSEDKELVKKINQLIEQMEQIKQSDDQNSNDVVGAIRDLAKALAKDGVISNNSNENSNVSAVLSAVASLQQELLDTMKNGPSSMFGSNKDQPATVKIKTDTNKENPNATKNQQNKGGSGELHELLAKLGGTVRRVGNEFDELSGKVRKSGSRLERGFLNAAGGAESIATSLSNSNQVFNNFAYSARDFGITFFAVAKVFELLGNRLEVYEQLTAQGIAIEIDGQKSILRTTQTINDIGYTLESAITMLSNSAGQAARQLGLVGSLTLGKKVRDTFQTLGNLGMKPDEIDAVTTEYMDLLRLQGKRVSEELINEKSAEQDKTQFGLQVLEFVKQSQSLARLLGISQREAQDAQTKAAQDPRFYAASMGMSDVKRHAYAGLHSVAQQIDPAITDLLTSIMTSGGVGLTQTKEGAEIGGRLTEQQLKKYHEFGDVIERLDPEKRQEAINRMTQEFVADLKAAARIPVESSNESNEGFVRSSFLMAENTRSQMEILQKLEQLSPTGRVDIYDPTKTRGQIQEAEIQKLTEYADKASKDAMAPADDLTKGAAGLRNAAQDVQVALEKFGTAVLTPFESLLSPFLQGIQGFTRGLSEFMSTGSFGSQAVAVLSVIAGGVIAGNILLKTLGGGFAIFRSIKISLDRIAPAVEAMARKSGMRPPGGTTGKPAPDGNPPRKPSMWDRIRGQQPTPPGETTPQERPQKRSIWNRINPFSKTPEPPNINMDGIGSGNNTNQNQPPKKSLFSRLNPFAHRTPDPNLSGTPSDTTQSKRTIRDRLGGLFGRRQGPGVGSATDQILDRTRAMTGECDGCLGDAAKKLTNAADALFRAANRLSGPGRGSPTGDVTGDMDRPGNNRQSGHQRPPSSPPKRGLGAKGKLGLAVGAVAALTGMFSWMSGAEAAELEPSTESEEGSESGTEPDVMTPVPEQPAKTEPNLEALVGMGLLGSSMMGMGRGLRQPKYETPDISLNNNNSLQPTTKSDGIDPKQKPPQIEDGAHTSKSATIPKESVPPTSTKLGSLGAVDDVAKGSGLFGKIFNAGKSALGALRGAGPLGALINLGFAGVGAYDGAMRADSILGKDQSTLDTGDYIAASVGGAVGAFTSIADDLTGLVGMQTNIGGSLETGIAQGLAGIKDWFFGDNKEEPTVPSESPEEKNWMAKIGDTISQVTSYIPVVGAASMAMDWVKERFSDDENPVAQITPETVSMLAPPTTATLDPKTIDFMKGDVGESDTPTTDLQSLFTTTVKDPLKSLTVQLVLFNSNIGILSEMIGGKTHELIEDSTRLNSSLTSSLMSRDNVHDVLEEIRVQGNEFSHAAMSTLPSDGTETITDTSQLLNKFGEHLDRSSVEQKTLLETVENQFGMANFALPKMQVEKSVINFEGSENVLEKILDGITNLVTVNEQQKEMAQRLGAMTEMFTKSTQDLANMQNVFLMQIAKNTEQTTSAIGKYADGLFS